MDHVPKISGAPYGIQSVAAAEDNRHADLIVKV